MAAVPPRVDNLRRQLEDMLAAQIAQLGRSLTLAGLERLGIINNALVALDHAAPQPLVDKI